MNEEEAKGTRVGVCEYFGRWSKCKSNRRSLAYGLKAVAHEFTGNQALFTEPFAVSGRALHAVH